jgi:hypothetical protein
MKLHGVLDRLARVVADEAERNPDFARRISEALGFADDTVVGTADHSSSETERRARNRRPAAVLDPVVVAREGEEVLRDRLLGLSLDQLKDIVAEFGMDTGKLVLKWKTPEKVVDRIVEISMARAQKGDAFRAG